MLAPVPGETVPVPVPLVALPFVDLFDFFVVRWRASLEAFRRRFVVPSALVEPDRAEQTITSLFASR